MIIDSKEELIKLIKNHKYMMDILQIVAALNLPDWWISAGFIKNKIWDVLHDYKTRTEYNDIDVIYFDTCKIDEMIEKEYENQLKRSSPELPWSVKNQARMHIRNRTDPYTSSVDAVNHYPERPTTICIKLIDNNEVFVHYDYDLEELFKGVVKPTPYLIKADKQDIYLNRIEEKIGFYYGQT
ncbi:nucleotidyltransferase family protein [Macrococcus caseolyticus]|uniref:nucleotidyltransferase family protein n=1 Tax=Macrococcoides caseolyticum TaxID=69966 RepID=UPI0024BC08D1|nr:nucleotidyltransferase family protein [Macrococcus caseolyticus]MDJ1109460.1 nucleotidyltransferase family protein [Macrococcus caseolyticus]